MHRVRDLLREGGLEVWTDEKLEPGTPSWKDAIQEALDTAKAIVVILSPDAKQSTWVKRELDYASTLNLRIFPVLARGSGRDAVPFLLAGAQYANITGDFDKGIQSFRRAIHNFLDVPLPQPLASPSPAHPVSREPEAIPHTTFVAQQLSLVPAPAIYVRLRQIAPLLLLIASVIFFGLGSDQFLDERNLTNILRVAAPIGLLAVGMTVVVLAGGIDLSVGRLMGLCGVITSLVVINSGIVSLPAMVLIAVGVGLVIGLITGYLVMRVRNAAVLQLDAQPTIGGLIPSILITLFILYLLNPIVLILTEGRPLRVIDDSLTDWYSEAIAGIPVSFILFLGVAVLAHLFMQRTSLYRNMAEARTNRQDARHRGIRVDRLTIGSFALLGMLTGLAAVVWIARFRSVDPNMGNGMELTVIAAVIVGGTSLFRAQGNVLRTIVGVLVVSVLPVGLIILGVSAYWQTIPTLGVVLLFVALDFLAMPRPKLVRVE